MTRVLMMRGLRGQAGVRSPAALVGPDEPKLLMTLDFAQRANGRSGMPDARVEASNEQHIGTS
jgi:hypothetical protein